MAEIPAARKLPAPWTRLAVRRDQVAATRAADRAASNLGRPLPAQPLVRVAVASRSRSTHATAGKATLQPSPSRRPPGRLTRFGGGFFDRAGRLALSLDFHPPPYPWGSAHERGAMSPPSPVWVSRLDCQSLVDLPEHVAGSCCRQPTLSCCLGPITYRLLGVLIPLHSLPLQLTAELAVRCFAHEINSSIPCDETSFSACGGTDTVVGDSALAQAVSCLLRV